MIGDTELHDFPVLYFLLHERRSDTLEPMPLIDSMHTYSRYICRYILFLQVPRPNRVS